jgi:hypothetical protein
LLKKYPNIALALLLAVVWAVASFQGQRVARLRDAETFFYWMVGTANQYRLEETLAMSDAPEDVRENDLEFFTRVNGQLDNVLPEVPLTEEDMTADRSHSKLVRIVRDAVGEQGVFKDTDQLMLVWTALNSEPFGAVRAEFGDKLARKQISNVLSQVSYADYSKAGGNLANLFFGFRKIAANFIWLQVDRFYHEGLTQRMYPLMMTCVALDPHFVDAFLLGAWHLAYNATAHLTDTPEALKTCDPRYGVRLGPKELYIYRGIDFLKDGIRKNPWNYKLYFDLGYSIYERKMDDHENAVKYLSEAIRYKHDRWVPRMLYRSLMLNKQHEEAIEGWQEYLTQFPDSEHAARGLAMNQVLLLEQRAEETLTKHYELQELVNGLQTEVNSLRDQVEQAPDESQKATLAAELALKRERLTELREKVLQTYNLADDLFNRAAGAYDTLAGPEGEDTWAVARLLWLRARAYVESERYLEAISLLDNARWQSDEIWDEATEEIISIKKLAAIELTVSEKLYIERQQEMEAILANAPPCP